MEKLSQVLTKAGADPQRLKKFLEECIDMETSVRYARIHSAKDKTYDEWKATVLDARILLTLIEYV
jgi:hypothetical protein